MGQAVHGSLDPFPETCRRPDMIRAPQSLDGQAHSLLVVPAVGALPDVSIEQVLLAGGQLRIDGGVDQFVGPGTCDSRAAL